MSDDKAACSVPCRECKGRGYHTWPSTARMGAGGMTLTTLTCVACDGTGNTDYPVPS